MARLPRLSLAGLPHHVLLRGLAGQPICADDTDRQCLLEVLAQAARDQQVLVQAWVLMPDHLHLLVTPPTPDALPHLVQMLGRRYVRHYNDRHGRRGTLWEGRYRSTVVQPGGHLLDCMVHLDLHPVQAGLVAEARDWPWSSHGHYVGLRHDRLLTPPAAYWQLGNTPFAREAAYAELVHAGLPEARRQAQRGAVLGGWVLGDPAFVARLQTDLSRPLRPRAPGRPRRPRPDSE